MSGIFWPANLFSGKKAVRANALTVGQYIRGKNGYVYKVVDLVSGAREMLITTFHEVMGQESFSVLPWELIECVDVVEGEGIPKEEEEGSVFTTGDDGDGGLEMGVRFRRRATGLDMARGRDRRMSNPLTSGEDTMRVASEYTMMALGLTKRRKRNSENRTRAKEVQGKRLLGSLLKNAADEAMFEAVNTVEKHKFPSSTT
jgi:hypothetical protein